MPAGRPRTRFLVFIALISMLVLLLMPATALAVETTLTVPQKAMVNKAINVLKLTGDQDALPAKLASADATSGFRRDDLAGADAKARLDGGRICYGNGYLGSLATTWPAGDASFPTTVGALARLPKGEFKNLVDLAETTLHEQTHTTQTSAQNAEAMRLFYKCEHERLECAAYAAELEWKLKLRAAIAAMPDSEAAARDAALATLDEMIAAYAARANAVTDTAKNDAGVEFQKSIWGTGPWADPSVQPTRPPVIIGDPAEDPAAKLNRVRTWREKIAAQVASLLAMLPPSPESTYHVTFPGVGGTLTLPSGLVSVDVAPFSFLEPAEVGIAQLFYDDIAPEGAASHLYEITPHGAYFEPGNPATLTFRVPVGFDLGSIGVYYLNDDMLPGYEETWIPVPGGVVDTVERTVSVQVSHFGIYGIGGGPEPEAVPASSDWSVAILLLAGLAIAAAASKLRLTDA